MENYNDFINRIENMKKYISIEKGYFKPNNTLVNKVNLENEFTKFYGDTVVFDLDDDIKAKIAKIIDEIYVKVPECFCEKRVTDTLHMTLHDLSNSSSYEEIKDEMDNNFSKLKLVLNNDEILPQIIKMKTKFVTDFSHTNLVLILSPQSEEEYEKLMKLYSIVNKVKILDYPFTPHITLAYYNIKGFNHELVNKLIDVLNKINENSFDVGLDTKKLIYQRFTDMNNYENIMKLVN